MGQKQLECLKCDMNLVTCGRFEDFLSIFEDMLCSNAKNRTHDTFILCVLELPVDRYNDSPVDWIFIAVFRQAGSLEDSPFTVG